MFLLQLETALQKAQKQVQQNDEQQSSLEQKIQSSMAGREDTVSIKLPLSVALLRQLSMLLSSHANCIESAANAPKIWIAL